MLTTPELAKTHLRIAAADTAWDAWLDQVVPQVDAAIRAELGRDVIEQQTGIVEYLAGQGNEVLLLTHAPVQAVTEVRVDSAGYAGQGSGFGAATVLTAGVDYYLESDDPVNGWSRAGRLVRIGGVWPRRKVRYPGQLSASAAPGAANVKVTYTAGWTAGPAIAPPDLTLAANTVIAQVRAAAKQGHQLQSERLGEYSYTLAQAAIQGALQAGTVPAILQRYRRLVV